MDTKNLEVTRRDTKVWCLQFKDGDDAPIDITGWTIYFTVKNGIEDADDDALIKKDITTHTNPTQGISSITLTPTDTDLSGTYYYDIQIKKVDSSILTIVSGMVAFEQDVTIRTT